MQGCKTDMHMQFECDQLILHLIVQQVHCSARSSAHSGMLPAMASCMSELVVICCVQ